MAVELGTYCKLRPDAQLIERLVGPLMSSLLGNELVAAWVDESNDSWTINWGGATTAVAVLLPQGSHEFGENWFASVAPGERGVELSLLLAIVVAVLIAVTCDGQLIDELSIVSSEPLSAAQVLVRMLNNSGRSAPEVLTALRGLRN